MHTITALSRLTGLSPSTVRTWERRYGVPKPARAANGRRRYSENDVDQLVIISRLVDAGHAISHLVTLSQDELVHLLERNPAPSQKTGAASFRERAIAAITLGDLDAYRRVLGETLSSLPPPAAAEHVIAPVFRDLGEMWAGGRVSIALEHAITAVTKQMLYSAAGATSWRSQGRRIIFAAVDGELHEIGVLLAYYIASAAGHTCTYFGPNLPSSEIPNAAAAASADLIVLGVVYSPNIDRTIARLDELGRIVPYGTPIWVGGPLQDIDLPPELRPRITLFSSLENYAARLSATRA